MGFKVNLLKKAGLIKLHEFPVDPENKKLEEIERVLFQEVKNHFFSNFVKTDKKYLGKKKEDYILLKKKAGITGLLNTSRAELKFRKDKLEIQLKSYTFLYLIWIFISFVFFLFILNEILKHQSRFGMDLLLFFLLFSALIGLPFLVIFLSLKKFERQLLKELNSFFK